MHKTIRLPKFVFTDSVIEDIRKTIGSRQPETGGVLGGPEPGKITRFFFDRDAETSRLTYSVNGDRINPVIAGWNDEGDHLASIIHSHPPGCQEPSLADVEFALRLLSRKDNDALPFFLIPIVQSAATGKFSMRLFLVSRQLAETVVEVPFEVVPSRELSPFPLSSENYRNTFTRVRDSYDLHRLHNSILVIVGCGGARAFVEEMARSGVRFFVLIDPDVMSLSNISTRMAYLSEVDKPKVDVVKRAILNINPEAVVTAYQRRIEAFSDDDMRVLMYETGSRGQEVEAMLLCGFSDSFWAQWRTSLLGLNFAVPWMGAQVYRGGAAAEIVFTDPATTSSCARCILSKRFEAFLAKGFRNDVGSEGAQPYATMRLNSTKFFVAQSILHHGTKHPFWGKMLARIGERNCIQIRCDPDVSTTLGLFNFDKAFAGADSARLFCDETVWLPQHPESRQNGYERPCPDCLGLGDLSSRMGMVEDTRQVVAEARRLAESHQEH